jgi:phosphatidylserine/phosphatidylglycerophosphate/cardiolipin synthase-like enzyme
MGTGRPVGAARRLAGFAGALAAVAALTLNAGKVCADEVTPGGRLEVAFSPDGGAETLVLRVIDSAQTSVRILAYTFTSRPVVRALIAARQRGVAVALVADAKSNLQEDRSGRAREALAELARAGCDVRVIDAFALSHDKVVVVDERTTELGSYNFTSAANRLNSETMLVVWQNPDLARQTLRHFARNYSLAIPFGASTRAQ